MVKSSLLTPRGPLGHILGHIQSLFKLLFSASLVLSDDISCRSLTSIFSAILGQLNVYSAIFQLYIRTVKCPVCILSGQIHFVAFAKGL